MCPERERDELKKTATKSNTSRKQELEATPSLEFDDICTARERVQRNLISDSKERTPSHPWLDGWLAGHRSDPTEDYKIRRREAAAATRWGEGPGSEIGFYHIIVIIIQPDTMIIVDIYSDLYVRVFIQDADWNLRISMTENRITFAWPSLLNIVIVVRERGIWFRFGLNDNVPADCSSSSSSSGGGQL